MKINGGFSPFQVTKAYAKQKKDATPVKKAEVSNQDSIEISKEARDLQTLKARMEQVPDVREEKVAKLKKQIANGEYKIDIDKLADKMAGEISQSAQLKR